MKKNEIIQTIILACLGLSIGLALSYYMRVSKERDDAIDRDVKAREQIIQSLKLKEAKQDAVIIKLQNEYNLMKDSLNKERANIKIQYIRYKEPVKVDLSTDAKRDSVIDKIIK